MIPFGSFRVTAVQITEDDEVRVTLRGFERAVDTVVVCPIEYAPAVGSVVQLGWKDL